MNITHCIDSECIGNNLYRFRFAVENVDKDTVKMVKEIEGDDYNPNCFYIRVYYDLVEDAIDCMSPCYDLMYLTNDGIDLELDSLLSNKQEKEILEYIRKELI